MLTITNDNKNKILTRFLIYLWAAPGMFLHFHPIFDKNEADVVNAFCLQTKYTILDERDIGLVHQYTFEPKLDIDKNGHGAKIFAVCFIYERGRETAVYVQDLLWERHHGGIAPGWTVLHRNCVTVDNR